MTDLADRELKPPREGGVSPLEGAELQRFQEKLGRRLASDRRSAP